MAATLYAVAPGRVNLVGDHTDYMDGLVLPMAIDRTLTITAQLGGNEIQLDSDIDPAPVRIALPVQDPKAVTPAWARYVAGVVVASGIERGLSGTVTSSIPPGAGLSSSAALEVATALVLGFGGSTTDLAAVCRRAEHLATGVPCGIMDQLVCVSAVEGHALLIDCGSLTIKAVPIPDDIEVVVVHSGVRRALAGSPYARRREECETAQREIGPLRDASAVDVARVRDPVARARARHVVTENERVMAFADALATGDWPAVGACMAESHRSLREDFAATVPAVDELVTHLARTGGVIGVRMTGAGFGGCVVALTERGVGTDLAGRITAAMVVKPAAGATLRHDATVANGARPLAAHERFGTSGAPPPPR